MQEKKVIAFIIPSLETGGAEHQTINQVNYLVEAGHTNIRLLVLSGRCHLMPDLKLDRKFIHIIEKNSIISVNGSLVKILPLLIRETRAFCRRESVSDIIAILPMAHLVCRLSKLINGLSFKSQPQLNVYYRDVYYQVAPVNTFSKKLFNYINKILANFYDNRALFISEAVYNDIRRNFFVPRSIVLPNSLPERDIPATKGKEFLEANKIVHDHQYLILIPGRLHFKKGHRIFIDAFKEFINEVQLTPGEVRIFIAGEGPMEEEIIRLIQKYELDLYFHLNGNTENTLLLSLYKCADLVVIPSIHEGFGNVAIEGLMQQSLMLVSDTGGLGEIIRNGENGFSFENANTIELKDKLKFLYRNRNKALIDREGLLGEFRNKYTVEKQVEKILGFCGLKT